MSEQLECEGYQVRTIMCSVDLDLLNIVHSDLFILIGEALIDMANRIQCSINKDIIKRILDFWGEQDVTITSLDDTAIEVTTGANLQTPNLLSGVLKLFANVKTDLKYNEEVRKVYRKKIISHSSDWILLIKNIADSITKKLNGKQPIIIFEDLDKLNPEDAWNVFYNYASILSGLPFPIIYTFPIHLLYDSKFAALEGYFKSKTLPMIKIESIDGNVFNPGVNIIKEIVAKRADLSLFENYVLDKLISLTGGSLRDLFLSINTAARRTERRKSEHISMEDADKAIEELKTSLTRRIEKCDYDFLVKIVQGNKELIPDKAMLLKMLQASVVLEYNGKRWHNVHPIVIEFLKEQGELR